MKKKDKWVPYIYMTLLQSVPCLLIGVWEQLCDKSRGKMKIFKYNYQSVIVAKSQKGSLSMSCGATSNIPKQKMLLVKIMIKLMYPPRNEKEV